MLTALTERYSNIAIGKILDVSEAAVRMMLKRAGIRRANRVLSSLDDWQAAVIRGELKAETSSKGQAEWEGSCRVSQLPLDASVDPADASKGISKQQLSGSLRGGRSLSSASSTRSPRCQCSATALGFGHPSEQFGRWHEPA